MSNIANIADVGYCGYQTLVSWRCKQVGIYKVLWGSPVIPSWLHPGSS